MKPKAIRLAGNSLEQRVVGRPFKPGQSGNPSGRPTATADFRKRCREVMEASGGGWDRAIEFRRSHNRREVQWAIEFLAAHAYGRPSQRPEVEPPQKFHIVVDLVEPRLSDSETVKTAP